MNYVVAPSRTTPARRSRAWGAAVRIASTGESRRRAKSWSGTTLYTIGHSTRTLDELVALPRAANVSVLADIRTMPRSRHNPQFNADSLPAALRPRGLSYVHVSELGGLRHARKHSHNRGWSNASFRGFADYMQTEEFETGVAELRALTGKGTVALMCAEAVPWRCHRSLVADLLTARGAKVEHLVGSSLPIPHRLTGFAKVKGERVTYSGEDVAGVRLTTRAPFHLEATVRVLQRRAGNRVEVWRENHYLRVFTTADGLLLVDVENRGTIDDPDIRLSIRSGNPSNAIRSELHRTVRKVLGLDMDLGSVQALAEGKPTLRPTALALRGMRPPRYPELFEAFANVVPFQQLSLDAGVRIVGRLVERFGKYVEYDGHRHYAFPAARTVANARLEALRECGLSRGKAECLRHLAKAIESGELTEAAISKMSTEDALQRLAELPGIGPWSAAVVLLRGFGRIDVFPPGDVGATRGLTKLLRLRTRKSLDRLIARFGEQRGYLYFCALGGSLLAKGLIHAAPPQSL
jgi:3-methyladenine DNA glycosylase/8-oxoguanine DNA glycosylase